MTETPRRKRFQIHLSTAVVMMIAAGAVMRANLIEREENIGWVEGLGFTSEDIFLKHFGWPLGAAGKTALFLPREMRYSSLGIVIDLFVALLILLVVGASSEWLIRWRAARTGT